MIFNKIKYLSLEVVKKEIILKKINSYSQILYISFLMLSLFCSCNDTNENANIENEYLLEVQALSDQEFKKNFNPYAIENDFIYIKIDSSMINDTIDVIIYGESNIPVYHKRIERNDVMDSFNRGIRIRFVDNYEKIGLRVNNRYQLSSRLKKQMNVFQFKYENGTFGKNTIKKRILKLLIY
jgi:hypothetical protein